MYARLALSSLVKSLQFIALLYHLKFSEYKILINAVFSLKHLKYFSKLIY